GNGGVTGENEPCPTLTTKDRVAKIFIDQQYGMSKPVAIDKPSGTLTGNPKLNIVVTEPWIMDTNFGNIGSSICEPSRTIVAARKHHYLIHPHISKMNDQVCIVSNESDSEMTVKIKKFMAAYGIIDIKMRMLNIPELLRIQGFPDDYELRGTKADQKKYI